ncbi:MULTISPECIES: GNAT family N-acetyltransferase [Streptosporangium]|uniref:GNAT superfamily N-acetyltransferase n=1 Tax=Streptosporangium brasiliense TaxID=47480 RepID=A0ABT9RA50_9ACTN|nr:GNAT family N-acetyltransferase [Streptosporangium brasiliense]MDP9866132.1 GNAT superfamily N-acetyltransferase [Streptosporangium brasiliense]
MTTEPALAGPVTDMTSLHLATRNAAAFWSALAQTRGHALVHRPGFVGVDGSERSGLRILLLSPEPDADDVAELTDLARRRSTGGVVVEDPFSSLDLGGSGLSPRRLPVMIRRPGPVPAPPAVQVRRVETDDQLETAERIVVHGFPLPAFQPHQAGEVFPTGLLGREGIELFLATRDGVPAGACMTVADGGVGGVYWVTTLPEHRSRGVGRALMHAVLGHLEGPVTLTSATAGKPLYDSLGFDTVTHATWWS